MSGGSFYKNGREEIQIRSSSSTSIFFWSSLQFPLKMEAMGGES
jgi:hypothetical protein